MPQQSPSAQDWRSVAELLGNAAACETQDDLIRALLAPLHALFPADLVIHDVLDGQMRQLAFHLFPYPNEGFVERTHPPFLEYFHEHPFQRDWVKTVGEGQVRLLSDRISGREFRRTAFWNEAFIHLHGKNQLLVGGLVSPGRYWNISLNRLGSDFGPRDRELARFLQPHLTRLFTRQAVREEASSALNFLEGSEAAYMVVDRENQILQISRPARTLLKESIAGGAVGAAASLSKASPIGFSVQNLGNVQAMMFRAKIDAPTFIILGVLPRAETPGIMRLTPREKDTLHWIGRGKTNPEIALVFGVSPRTVEKHCERLFAKLGVDNRHAAALLAR